MVVITEVMDHTCIKPYLGGWRHKVTDVKYFNATTQTPPREPRVSWDNMCSREVQVVEIKDEGTQSLCDRATQMWRNDCYVSNEMDKYMTVNAYENCEEREKRLDLDGKARIIQKNYKVYRLLKFMKECAYKYRCIKEEYKRQQEEKDELNRRRIQRLILRKVCPQTANDFDMLYDLIDRWRSDYLGDLRSRYFKAGQRAENYFVLEKTVQMFNIIGRHRGIISDRCGWKKRARFLTENCKPVRWVGRNGKLMEMVTLKVQKAREWKNIYDSLDNENLTIHHRVQVLITLKKYLQRHKCMAALRLEELLNQELILLSRGINNSSFDYLKKRTASFFLYFLSPAGACTCDNVGEGTSNTPGSEELREPLEKRTILCRICMKILPYHKLSVHSRTRRISSCNGCAWLRQRSIKHINYDPYIFILNCVRADEQRQNCSSKIPFLMQGPDIYVLVNTIWHACSIISKNRDIFRLRMVRFHVDVEWAPWNCILLTEDEAEIHVEIKDMSSVYTKFLMDDIYLRHLTAKNHFKNLTKLHKNSRQSSLR